MCGDRVILFQRGQYHGCWYSGSLQCQDISSHDIDYVKQVSCGLIWGRISTTYGISAWQNDIKCKYMYVSSENLASKEFMITATYLPS